MKFGQEYGIRYTSMRILSFILAFGVEVIVEWKKSTSIGGAALRRRFRRGTSCSLVRALRGLR